MVNGTRHICEKRHPVMPPEFEMVRCAHGRIGTQDYAIIECVGKTARDHGIVCYSVVPSETVYCLVTMHKYDKTDQQTKDATYNWLKHQLRQGLKPVDCIIHTVEGNIGHIQHTQDSMAVLMEWTYFLKAPIPARFALMYGRIPRNAEFN